jgi:hypothetical protein
MVFSSDWGLTLPAYISRPKQASWHGQGKAVLFLEPTNSQRRLDENQTVLQLKYNKYYCFWGKESLFSAVLNGNTPDYRAVQRSETPDPGTFNSLGLNPCISFKPLHNNGLTLLLSECDDSQ